MCATYLGLAAALVIVAAVVWTRRKRLNDRHDQSGGILKATTLLRRLRFAFGAACIFLYVGAEVAIGSLIVNYLEQASVLGVYSVTADKHVPFYWGGALVGRFIESAVLRVVSPGKVLLGMAAGAILLVLISANSTGAVAAWSLLAIGLMNSIMFPTIFSLASEGLGLRSAEGSGIIVTAIVGGAIIPPLTGKLVDASTLQAALAIQALCHLVIGCFGLEARLPASGDQNFNVGAGEA